ncbi:MAG: DM13 domain-containing protein [Pseudomonadota bacterium]
MRFAAAAITIGLVIVAGSATADEVISEGTFVGASNHVTVGGVTVKKGTGGSQVELHDDFSLDGAPDPKLGFGNDGQYDTASRFSVLNDNTGAQTYDLPDGIDPSAYNEIYVWCEKFSVPLGVAKLQ